MSDTVTRRLQVVGCEVRYQGSNDKGPYTIYEIAAYNHPKHGRSYTLKLPGQGGSKSPGARLGPKVDALREDLERQQQQIGELNRRLAELEGRLNAAPTGGLMSRTTPTPDEEDIPF
jgi:hypothetical protein